MYGNIKAELARHDLKISDLAESLGITTQSMYNKLNGKYDFNLSELTSVKRFFELRTGEGFTLEYLFRDTNSDGGAVSEEEAVIK